MSASPNERLSRTGLLLLLAITLGWGFNWPIMKIVLRDVPPLYFRGFCLSMGGLGMLALARANGHTLAIPRRYWAALAGMALGNIIGWNVLATYGVKLLPSGRAALLGYTMPLWSMVLSVVILKEAITRRRVLGLILGLAGVGFLLGEGAGAMLATPVGALCMIGAAWSWAIGIVLLKRYPLPISTTVLTGWMMLVGGLPLLLAAWPLETDQLRWPHFWPAFGLAYNIGVAFMFCYWAWNRIVLMVPVAVSSLSSLVTPLVGVFGGMAILGERPGWQEYVAAGLILAAVATVTIPGRSARR